MQFVELSRESNNETLVASISEINGNTVLLTPAESLNNLKMSHTKGIKLDMNSTSRGLYQTIRNMKLAEDGTSALAQISLPKDSSHEHDTYYHVHPALFDGATFQLLNLLSDLDAGNWTPTRVSRAVMHRSSIPAWTYLVIIEDGLKMKSCQVELFDESGLP